MQPPIFVATMKTTLSAVFQLRGPRGPAFLQPLTAWCGCALLTAAVWAGPAAAQRPAAEAVPKVTLSTTVADVGDPLLVQVDCGSMPAAAGRPVVSFGDQAVPLFAYPAEGNRAYAGLVGIGLAAHPGPAEVKVAWSEGARQRSTSAVFTIRSGAFAEETLKVDPRHVRPGPRDLERIRREQAELKQIYASGRPSRLWQGGFRVPVPGEMNGPFGTRRVFNGELQSQHSGVDYRAQSGDPVHAAGAGVVRLAKDLFYSGNAVVVDHGAGIFTSYSHLSRMDVRVGQRVEKGMVVGLAGATGRATGPHLHWGVKVNSVSVNPLAFIRLTDLLSGG